MERRSRAGYPIRVMFMPIIPIPDWQRPYDDLLEQLLTRVRLDRITPNVPGSPCRFPFTNASRPNRVARTHSTASR
jgi:hypothetical protein